MCMYNVDLCSPTVADDMVLVYFSKSGLDQMLALRYNYAMKWRLEYTTAKCALVICNSPDKGHSEHSFHMGQQQIEIVDQYTHLGITCDNICQHIFSYKYKKHVADFGVLSSVYAIVAYIPKT